MTPAVGAAVIGVATALLVVAVLAEATWLWVAGDDAVGRRLRTAAAMGAGGLVASQAVHHVDGWISPTLAEVAPQQLAQLWHRQPLLAAVAAFVAWDAAGYTYHWIGHRTRIGWASHRVHHTGDAYDLTLAWRQSWLPLPALVAFAPVALLGFDATLLAVCAAVSLCWQALVHTSVPVRLPAALAAVLVTPATHRRHHLRACPTERATNLGPVLTVWDRLFGTWDARPVERDASYGIEGSESSSAVEIELAGWRELLGVPNDVSRLPARRRPVRRASRA